MDREMLAAAAKELALTTARKIRQPVEHIVRRPRTQRYFLKHLRRRPEFAGIADDVLREVIFALEPLFPPPEITEPESDRRTWWRRVKRLTRRFPPMKLHEHLERARRHLGWHHELTLNVLIVAENEGRVVFDDPIWRRRDAEQEETDMRIVSQEGTRRKAAMRIVPVQRRLRVTLTEKERREALEQSGALWGELEVRRAELAELKRSATAAIRLKEQELAEAMRRANERAEEREVRCEERHFYDIGRVRVIRLDTGALVEERDMTVAERQLVHPALSGREAATSAS